MLGEGSVLFGGGGAMVLPRVWDLSYFGWVKATVITHKTVSFSLLWKDHFSPVWTLIYIVSGF